LENLQKGEPPVLVPSYALSLAGGGIVAVIDALAELREQGEVTVRACSRW